MNPIVSKMSAASLSITSHGNSDDLIDTLEPESFADNAGFDTDDTEPLSIFPGSALPAQLREYFLYLTQTLRFDPTITAPTILSALSAAIGKGLQVQSGQCRYTPANTFMLIAARSGTGKSQAFQHIMSPLYEVERRGISQWSNEVAPKLRIDLAKCQKELGMLRKSSCKTADGARELALEKELDALTRKLVPPQMFVGDVTREALADMLAKAPKEVLSSISPEAGGVLEVLGGRYHSGSTDEDIYLSAFSGEHFKMNRKSGTSIQLTNPWLSLHWMTQPDKLQKFLSDPRLANSGFFQRCLMAVSDCTPQMERWEEDTTSAKSAEPAKLWSATNQILLKCYRETSNNIALVVPCADARELLIDHTNSLIQRRGSGGDLVDMDGYVARWGENLWKLSLLLHAARYLSTAHERQLDANTAEAAIAISKWFAAHQQELLSPALHSKTQDLCLRLLTILKGTGKGRSTLRDLKRRNNLQPDEIKNIVRLFPETFDYIKTISKKSGRPSELIFLK